jgi:hypothetical protein
LDQSQVARSSTEHTPIKNQRVFVSTPAVSTGGLLPHFNAASNTTNERRGLGRNRFQGKKPSAHNFTVEKFLQAFEIFSIRENLQEDEILDALLQCVKDTDVRKVQKYREKLINRPWKAIREEIRQILEPNKSIRDYLEQFYRLKAKNGETYDDYVEKFNSLAAIVNIEDPRLEAEIFFKGLPEPMQDRIFESRISVETQSFIPFASADEAQKYIAARIRDKEHFRFRIKSDLDVKYRNQAYSSKHPEKFNTTLYKKVECYKCHEIGHYARNCPQLEHKNIKEDKKQNKPQATYLSKSNPKDKKHSKSTNAQSVTTLQEEKYSNDNESNRQANYICSLWDDSSQFNKISEVREVVAELIDYKALLKEETSRALTTNTAANNANLPTPLTRPAVSLIVNGISMSALLDTGADNSFITSSALQALPDESYTISKNTINVKLAEGDIRTRQVVELNIHYNNKQVKFPFGVLIDDRSCILMGYDLINLLQVSVPMVTQDQLQGMFEKFKVVDIDTILEQHEKQVFKEVIPHPEQAIFLKKIQPAINANLATEFEHCILPPVAIKFINPDDRRKGSWQVQFRLSNDFEDLYSEVIQDYLKRNIIEPQFDNIPHTPTTGQYNTSVQDNEPYHIPITNNSNKANEDIPDLINNEKIPSLVITSDVNNEFHSISHSHKADTTHHCQNEADYNIGHFNTRAIGVKSGGKKRIVYDFVHINHLLESDTNNVPAVDEAFIEIAKANPNVFSKIDLRSAYLQIPLRECDRPITAFTCKRVRYRFVTAPLGLKHLPSTFQRMISGLLQQFNCTEYTYNHFDDIFIFSHNIDIHLKHVLRVLEALTSVKLTISQQKCFFFVIRVPLLGSIIEPHGIRPNYSKLCNMLDWDRPTTKKKLQRYLGIVNFFRKFIPSVSDLLQPLLRIKNDKFIWTNDMEICYKRVFNALVSNTPFLYFPVPGVTLQLATDASDSAIGAALFQVINGETHYLGFHSRVLQTSEKNYTIPKKELLSAIVHIEHYRYLLLGVHFYLHIDNQAIVMALRLSANPQRERTIMGWIAKLSEYSFTAFHLEGKLNILPDLASRVQVVSTSAKYSNDEIYKIIDDAHSIGHFGASVMYKHITVTQEIAGIPNLYQLCLDKVNKCRVCRAINDYRKVYSPLAAPKVMLPMEKVYLDVLEVGIISYSGNAYLSVIVDELTGFIWVAASPTKDAERIFSHLQTVFTMFGFPSIAFTDGGKEYRNKLFKCFADCGATTHILSIAHNHHENSKAERANRTIRNTVVKKSLAATGSEKNWDIFVSAAMLDLNTKIQASTEASPFALMFGRSPFRAGEGAQGLLSQKEVQEKLILFWKTYIEQVVPKLQQFKAAKQEKRSYKKKIAIFQVGDIVMLHKQVVANKAEPRYTGPYRVKQVLSNSKYEIEGKHSTLTVPTNYLKKVTLNEGEELYNNQKEEELPQEEYFQENLSDKDYIQQDEGKQDLKDNYDQPVNPKRMRKPTVRMNL